MIIVAGLWFFLVNSVRIKELNYRLKSSTDQSKSVRNSSLLSRFKLLRAREAETTGPSAYAREGRIMQILADSAYLNTADDLNIGERAAKLTVDFFDLISGSPVYRHEKNTTEYKLLEKAFYHEITRSYREAISQYDFMLEPGKKFNPQGKYYTMLHRGFCHALVGERANAIKDFEVVIAESKEPEYVDTARQLLAMIQTIDREIKQVDAMPVSTQKGAAYYGLTAYDQAIGTLRKLDNVQANPEAMFYLARSLEEKGNAAEAVEFYRKLIAVHAKSDWSKKANRRLYALGAFYAAGKDYRQESTANIEKGVVKDKELLEESQRFQKVSERIDAGEKKIVAELVTPVAKAIPEAKATPEAKAVPEKTEIAAAPAVKEKSIAAPAKEPGIVAAKTEPAKPKTETSAPKGPAIDWEKLEKLPRAAKIKYIAQQKSVEQILLENGSQFKGLLITEDKETVSIFTMLGRVVIEKSEIETRSRQSQ